MKYRYNEDQILKDLMEYLESTYKKHYASGDGWPHLDGFQVNDLFMSLGMSGDIYVSNAVEYLARYGRKGGKNKQDLFKAIHNIIFLLNMDHYKPAAEGMPDFEAIRSEPGLNPAEQELDSVEATTQPQILLEKETPEWMST